MIPEGCDVWLSAVVTVAASYFRQQHSVNVCVSRTGSW